MTTTSSTTNSSPIEYYDIRNIPGIAQAISDSADIKSLIDSIKGRFVSLIDDNHPEAKERVQPKITKEEAVFFGFDNNTIEKSTDANGFFDISKTTSYIENQEFSKKIKTILPDVRVVNTSFANECKGKPAYLLNAEEIEFNFGKSPKELFDKA